MTLSVENKKLREAFGMFATGVTVVTTRDSLGIPVGFTANSFTSVSIDPPMLLVCVSVKSRSFEAITLHDRFSVNILAATQKSICDVFSSPIADRFAGVDWVAGPAGNPLITACSAWFDCQLTDTVHAGDHVVILGKITDFAINNIAPLIMVRGQFQSE